MSYDLMTSTTTPATPNPFLELLTSNNPAYRLMRYAVATGRISLGKINFDRLREAAEYCDREK